MRYSFKLFLPLIPNALIIRNCSYLSTLSDNLQGYNEEIFRQDLDVFSDNIRNKDFRSGNILANRIMSNAYFFDEKYFGIIGFFLRQFAIDGLNFNTINKIEGVNLIKDKTSEFVDKIKGQLNTEKNLGQLWIAYSNIMMVTRPTYLVENERKYYKTELEFTNQIFEKIFKFLFKNLNELTYPTNNMLKGILNEIQRVMKTHGADKTKLYLLSIILMLERIDEYIGMTALDKDEFKRRVEKEIIPNVQKIESIVSRINDPEVEGAVNEILWDLIKQWRTDFVKFLEPRSQAQLQSKGKPTITEPVKSELVDELAESLEDEVAGK